MRRLVMTSLTLAAAAGTFISLSLSAVPVASAGTSITATYPVSGSTYIKAISSTVSLGPGTLVSTVDPTTSAITAATLTLPPATASFRELGFVPVTATTALIQDGTGTGKINLSKNTVTVTSHITMRITSLKVAGLPVPVGRRCQTRTPATITVHSRPGFAVLAGGTVTGTYTIPGFSHCGLATALINLTIPGPDNTITLKLGAAKV